jgi:hypothetical protein
MMPSDPTPRVDQENRFRKLFTFEQGEIFLAQLEKVMAETRDADDRHRAKKAALLLVCSNGHLYSMVPQPEIMFPAPSKE